MTSMYNKLCNKQDGLFSSSRSYLHKGQGYHQMSLKIHTNHLISSSCVFFMTKFSSFDTFIRIYNQTMKFVMKTMHVGHLPI